MGLMEEARLARLRGFKVSQKKGSMNNAFTRFKDFIVGNF
jgi:cell division protein FtsA